ncbi:flavin-containing monooxygenase [Nocardia sp. NPDC127579]|uniref:flavin-containing monooxygenase n=1 Tax=Nocardia sp. NPDC127579 TaxID=3345402 RepID=UPI003635E485
MRKTTTFPTSKIETTRVRVAIIGAGFGGIGAAIQLDLAGIRDFVIIERAAEVGGTWQANTYPGAQCDIPSILYSFSFAPNPAWTRLYPLQPEIKNYLRECVERFGIGDRLRLEHDMLDATWDEAAQRWRVATSRGDFEAEILIGAFGPFSAPARPAIPGLETFGGQVVHTAEWNHDHDLNGARIAVIGTGASAVQIIPRLQPRAAKLTVFQRTPTWIMPHPDRPMSGRPQRLFERLPLAQRLARTSLDLVQEALVPGLVWRPALLRTAEQVGRAHLRRQISDPALRAKLTPGYSFGCKRPTFSNTYYPALAAANSELVTDGIREITPSGIVTTDGAFRAVDTIVLGTGFRLTDHPVFARFRGRDGRPLDQVWNGNAKAYLGTVVHGFPNFFMMLGPNSVTYTSQVVTIEAQIAYVISVLRQMERRALTSVDIRADVQDAFVAEMEEGLGRSVWNAGGCSSYYIDDSGRNFVFYPGFSRQYQRRTRRARLGEFEIRTAGKQTDSAVREVSTPR